MNVVWKISTLDRDTSNNFVMTAHWQCTAIDGEYTASVYSTCSWASETPTIPYAELTEAAVVQWVKDSLGEEGVAAVDAALAANIADQKAPKVATGTPWSN